MTVTVVIGGHVDDDGHRKASRAWIFDWYRLRGFLTVESVSRGRPWAKADAYNPPVAACSTDVVVLADGDCMVSEMALRWSIAQAADIGWSVPFSAVHRLSQDSTAATLACDPATTERPPLTGLSQSVHDALPGGGIVAMRTDLARECGPFDPRFRGWGGEDFALGNAARTLCGEYAAQHDGPLWHLWHPPQPRTAEGDHATNVMATRYRLAKFRPDDMRALIEEGRNAG